jgi:hypothetical protein
MSTDLAAARRKVENLNTELADRTLDTLVSTLGVIDALRRARWHGAGERPEGVAGSTILMLAGTTPLGAVGAARTTAITARLYCAPRSA